MTVSIDELGPVFLKKDEGGSLEAFEASDLGVGEIGELRGYERDLAMVLSEQDVADLAASGRIPVQAVLAEVPWSSPTASTVGATGPRTAGSTNLERLTAQVARKIEGEAGYELRCRTA